MILWVGSGSQAPDSELEYVFQDPDELRMPRPDALRSPSLRYAVLSTKRRQATRAVQALPEEPEPAQIDAKLLRTYRSETFRLKRGKRLFSQAEARKFVDERGFI